MSEDTPSLMLIDPQWRLYWTDGKIFQITVAEAAVEGDMAILSFSRAGDNMVINYAGGTTKTVEPL